MTEQTQKEIAHCKLQRYLLNPVVRQSISYARLYYYLVHNIYLR